MTKSDIKHHVLADHHLILLKIRGQNSMSALLTYLFQLPTIEPDYRPDMAFLIDAKDAKSTGRSSDEERQNVDKFMQEMPQEFDHQIRVATVLHTGLEYGLSRMYNTYLDLPFIDYQLFDDVASALIWLALPPELETEIKPLI